MADSIQTDFATELFGDHDDVRSGQTDVLTMFRDLSKGVTMKVQDKAALAELKMELDKVRKDHQRDKEELDSLAESTEASIHDRDLVIKYSKEQYSECVQDKRNLEAALDEEQQIAREHMETLERVSSEELAKKDVEIKELREELDKYEKYKELKEQHDQVTMNLREELDTLAEAHQKKVMELDQQLRAEVKALQLEKEREIEECKDEMLLKMQSKLDQTTKSTIKENGQMRSELRFQSHRW
jgi:chromosome segregation ATPase